MSRMTIVEDISKEAIFVVKANFDKGTLCLEFLIPHKEVGNFGEAAELPNQPKGHSVYWKSFVGLLA
jgi:hypothetical protein